MGERTGGLSLAPFRGLRYAVDEQRLGRVLCPPYDVIDAATRAGLVAADPQNAVELVLPEPTEAGYAHAAALLHQWRSMGTLQVDAAPALYVYQMSTPDGGVTRGLLGGVELRDYDDGVILPHENTMAGPVSDRLSLMTATQANLEPIYLVYDGGGAASELVRAVDGAAAIASATTPDGIVHELWAVTDPDRHRAVAEDLAGRRALIADGHHRYATYLELQRRARAQHGNGPWDRGLTLLVDSSAYGPQVHAIHRVLNGRALDPVLAALTSVGSVGQVADIESGMAAIDELEGFAMVITDSVGVYTFHGHVPVVLEPDEPAALGVLDVSVLHRGLLGPVLGITDSVDAVGYAHGIDEALSLAATTGGTAVLLRPTPVAAVSAVAAAGARMPRKSTLFTPKPASGFVIRAFADQD